jgi:hypothetical protein
LGTEIRESLMEGMSRTAWRAGASVGWKVVRKMGGVEGGVGSEMNGCPEVEVWSAYHGGGMECLGVGGCGIFEEAIMTLEVDAY